MVCKPYVGVPTTVMLHETGGFVKGYFEEMNSPQKEKAYVLFLQAHTELLFWVPKQVPVICRRYTNMLRLFSFSGTLRIGDIYGVLRFLRFLMLLPIDDGFRCQ